MSDRAPVSGPRRRLATQVNRNSEDLEPLDALHRRFQHTRDLDLRNLLVERHAGLAHAMARRCAHWGESLDDLQQVAAMGLIKAVDRFDHERGCAFSTFAVPTISGELRRHRRDHSATVRVPRGVRDARHACSLARDELTQRWGRAPSTAEVAEHVGLPFEEALAALGAWRRHGSAPIDVDAAADPSPAIAETGTDRALLDALMRTLPAREQQILVLRFVGDLTQREIAQHVGISQMHVSRLLRRSLTQLRSMRAASGARVPGHALADVAVLRV